MPVAVSVDELSRSDGPIPPLQLFQRHAYRARLPQCNACGRISDVEIARTLRQEGRKRNHDPCSSLSSPHERKQRSGKANLDSSDSRTLTGFRAVYVFDESMTGGNPLPQIGSLNGDPGTHRERLEQFVRDLGIALEYSADIAPAKGLSEGGKIKLLPGQSPAETVATLSWPTSGFTAPSAARAQRSASARRKLRPSLL